MPSNYFYRGVHAGHPRIEDAKNGVVIPGDLAGSITPEQHNLGDVSRLSQFTSWSSRIEVAQKNAYNYGAGGVVLRVTGEEPSLRFWHWIDSPDIFDEGERLLFGVRINIEVIRAMTSLDKVKSRIAAAEVPSSRSVQQWLEQENPKLIANTPALVTAHQALRVWRVRLDTSRARHRGMQELVTRLEEMTPQSKVEQYSFRGKKSTALMFFKKRDSQYIGSIVVEG